MTIYGIKINDIKHIKVDGVKELLKTVGAYDTCISDCTDDNSNISDNAILEWLENYESECYHGIGALLYDAIVEREYCDINIDEADGSIYVGLGLGLPWWFSPATKRMTETEYKNMLLSYVNKITDDTVIPSNYTFYDDADY